MNKNISVWRGEKTPPTKYHLWQKNDTIYVNIEDEWLPLASVKSIQLLEEVITNLNRIKNIELVEVNASNNNILKSYRLKSGNNYFGTTIDIPKDRAIKDVKLGYLNASVNSETGLITIGTGTNPLYMIYSIALEDGSYKMISIDLSLFITEKEYKDGLELVDNALLVKIDKNSDPLLTISSNGVKLEGVQDKFNSLDTDIATIKEKFAGKLDKASVVQEFGNSEELVISQKAVSNKFNELITSLKAEFSYKGIATPTTNPGTPDGNVFYLATEAGVYSNFNNIEITDTVYILKWQNGIWAFEDTSILIKDIINTKLSKLEEAQNANRELIDNINAKIKNKELRACYYTSNAYNGIIVTDGQGYIGMTSASAYVDEGNNKLVIGGGSSSDSNVAIVIMNVDFSNEEKGQVTLNLGTLYSITFVSGNHYTVIPNKAYEDSAVNVKVIPDSGYTFVSDDAGSDKPVAPSISMAGKNISATLDGEFYIGKISSVVGDIFVSGGKATAKAPTYLIQLNFTGIIAKLSSYGEAITSIAVKQGGSKTIYLTTDNAHILPTTFETSGCTIELNKIDDRNGTLKITASNNGSVTAVGVEVVVPTYSLPQETTFNGTYGNTKDHIDTGVRLWSDGIADFTILCKFKLNEVSEQSDYYVKCVFGASSESPYAINIRLNHSGSIYFNCFGKESNKKTAQLVEYIAYIGFSKTEKKTYYKIKNLKDDSFSVEGSMDMLYPNIPDSEKYNTELWLGGNNNDNGYYQGCAATVHSFEVYKGTFMNLNNSQVQSYFN